MENDDLASDLLDGVPAIAEFLGLTARQVYHLADPKLGDRPLPLFKIGERKWNGRRVNFAPACRAPRSGGGAMILYHFTRPNVCRQLWSRGYGYPDCARGWSKDDLGNAAMAGGQAAVWFTEAADNKPTLECRRRMLKYGILAGPEVSAPCRRHRLPSKSHSYRSP